VAFEVPSDWWGIRQVMKNQLFAGVALTLVLLPAGAVAQTRRAETIGVSGNGHGKCRIEVAVERSATLEVQGDTAHLGSTSGSADWRRFQCAFAMPPKPDMFRLVKVEGRGRVLLVRDPRTNGGRAVIRIEQPDANRETYRIELSWGPATLITSFEDTSASGFPHD
jgi:hypothetical protein